MLWSFTWAERCVNRMRRYFIEIHIYLFPDRWELFRQCWCHLFFFFLEWNCFSFCEVMWMLEKHKSRRCEHSGSCDVFSHVPWIVVRLQFAVVARCFALQKNEQCSCSEGIISYAIPKQRQCVPFVNGFSLAAHGNVPFCVVLCVTSLDMPSCIVLACQVGFSTKPYACMYL